MRIFRFNFLVVFLLWIMAGCSTTNYLMKDKVPADLSGFMGYRWAATMDAVDDEMEKSSTPKSVPRSEYASSLSYSNVYFLEKKMNLCHFIFDSRGFSEIQITFRSAPMFRDTDLQYFRDRLSKIYGRPQQMTRTPAQKEFSNYVNGYYWFNGRLTLVLFPGSRIMLYAFRDRQEPPDSPPTGPATRKEISPPVKTR